MNERGSVPFTHSLIQSLSQSVRYHSEQGPRRSGEALSEEGMLKLVSRDSGSWEVRAEGLLSRAGGMKKLDMQFEPSLPRRLYGQHMSVHCQHQAP